jgi:hypothetical protein
MEAFLSSFRLHPSSLLFILHPSAFILAFMPVMMSGQLQFKRGKNEMDWMNQLGGILQQYSGAQADQPPDTVDDDFSRLAQTAPQSAVADGLAEAFRSNQTPAFGQMVSQLFSNANGQQRAGILNTLISALGPTIAAQIFSQSGLSGLAGLLGAGQRELTPEQATQVSPEAVREIAEHAESKDPSIIDRASNFYAEHPTLVKTLGAAALTIALAKLAERQQNG